ncbi:ABC transporter ATP-binding protein [uncultured Thermanaerothrix sp.]|uniref:ABC transporter ATP-binding protein n=1 Tax=uncultured Thermanaerothrix sp. TaxID=1195149 RepID=UPI00260F45BC|nr:ABC transporter ATP-binding protein [uncultured Thermanaerothrix sp.]
MNTRLDLKGSIVEASRLYLERVTVVLQGQRILENVSLSLERGQVVALIGPNGAGKSTLIRAISGVITPQAGSIQVGDLDLVRASPWQRARYLAVVPQIHQLPPAFTVWQTVLLGRTPYLNLLGQVSPRDEAVARQALEQVEALPLAERGLAELSGGELQRVLLARALAQQTPFLLLDEPTTHLDWQYQVALLTHLRRLADNGTTADLPRRGVLMVLHDLNLAVRYADQVALLVGGRLWAWGTTREVLQPDLLSRAFGLTISMTEASPDGYPLFVPLTQTRARMSLPAKPVADGVPTLAELPHLHRKAF